LWCSAPPCLRTATFSKVSVRYAYPRFQAQKLKLALKIGGRCKIHELDQRRWRTFAREARVDEAELIVRAKAMAAAIPDEFATLRAQATREGIEHAVLGRSQTALAQHTARCAARFT
jgi:hypothetical protein